MVPESLRKLGGLGALCCLLGCSSEPDDGWVWGAAGGAGDAQAPDGGSGSVSTCPTERFVTAGDPSCDTGRGGPMREIPLPGGGVMCVDKTEVTVGQYQTFLADPNKPTLPPSDPAASRCAKKSSFEPTCYKESCEGSSCDLPQSCVDQCDAKMFCAWAGKRLCGPIGASPLGIAFSDLHDPTKNQWMNACFSGDREWPYGSVYDGQACNTTDRSPAACGAPAVTSSFPGCQAPDGPYDQVFDLSGNVSEWVDASQEAEGWPELRCIVMGGSYVHWWGDVGCKGATLEWPCDAQLDEFGFRCCSI